jgi:hypothetical protein
VSNNIERLTTILGFDPAKSGGSILKEALDEVNKKRAEAHRAKAIALIEQAIDLRQKFDEAERKFNAEKKKFDKELGRLVGRIEAMQGGKSPQQIEAEEKDKDEQQKENTD